MPILPFVLFLTISYSTLYELGFHILYSWYPFYPRYHKLFLLFYYSLLLFLSFLIVIHIWLQLSAWSLIKSYLLFISSFLRQSSKWASSMILCFIAIQYWILFARIPAALLGWWLGLALFTGIFFHPWKLVVLINSEIIIIEIVMIISNFNPFILS